MDFNREEEEKKKKKEDETKAASEKPKELVKNKEGRHVCGNFGCTKRTFDPSNEEDMKDDACNYH